MAPDPERQTKINVAVLANTVTDPYESFYNSMLSTLLFNGPNSPMHQSLIDSNIGQSYSPSTGYEAVGRYVPPKSIQPKKIQNLKFFS